MGNAHRKVLSSARPISGAVAARRASRIVQEIADELGAALPHWVPWFAEHAALKQQLEGRKPSIFTVCDQLKEAAAYPYGFNGFLDGFLTTRGLKWKPAEDGLDRVRLEIVARLVSAGSRDRTAHFPLFSPERLLHAVDVQAASDPRGDAQATFKAMARALSDGGARRQLALTPTIAALEKLGRDMPNFAAVVDFYIGQVALLQLKGSQYAKFPPVLLLGPPGVGKTRFAQSLAAIIGSPFRVLPMGSQTAGWIIGGSDSTWSTSKPGLVFNTLSTSRVANPLLLVDEVDKASHDVRYDPLGSLYTLWEADSSVEFIDEYVGIPVNASAVIWVATANYWERIPQPLLNRLTVFDVGLPDPTTAWRIVQSQFDRIRDGAPFTPLSAEVIERLTPLAPRAMGVFLRQAVGRAARRAREAGADVATVLLQDLPELDVDPEPRVGFLP